MKKSEAIREAIARCGLMANGWHTWSVADDIYREERLHNLRMWYAGTWRITDAEEKAIIEARWKTQYKEIEDNLQISYEYFIATRKKIQKERDRVHDCRTVPRKNIVVVVT